jgi:hypothetical protein
MRKMIIINAIIITLAIAFQKRLVHRNGDRDLVLEAVDKIWLIAAVGKFMNSTLCFNVLPETPSETGAHICTFQTYTHTVQFIAILLTLM